MCMVQAMYEYTTWASTKNCCWIFTRVWSGVIRQTSTMFYVIFHIQTHTRVVLRLSNWYKWTIFTTAVQYIITYTHFSAVPNMNLVNLQMSKRQRNVFCMMMMFDAERLRMKLFANGMVDVECAAEIPSQCCCSWIWLSLPTRCVRILAHAVCENLDIWDNFRNSKIHSVGSQNQKPALHMMMCMWGREKEGM